MGSENALRPVNSNTGVSVGGRGGRRLDGRARTPSPNRNRIQEDDVESKEEVEEGAFCRIGMFLECVSSS